MYLPMNSRGFAFRRRLIPRTPEPWVAVLALLLEGVVIGLIARSVTSGASFFFSVVLLSLCVSATFKKKSGKFRRVAFMHLVTTLIVLPFVSLLFILPESGIWIFGAVLSVAGFLYAATLYSALGRGVGLSLGFAIGFYLIYYVSLSGVHLPPLQVAINAAFSFLAFLLFAIGLERIKLGALSSREAIARFADSWIDRGSTNFDDLLTNLGRKHTAIISVHSFVSATSRVATLVVPYIHPGPVKNMGSGELPSLIYAKLSDHNPLIFHGASDHTLNLTSRDEAERLSDGVSRFVLASEPSVSPVTEIVVAKTKFKGVRISRYELNGQRIYFVSKERSTEDLPVEILPIATSRGDVIDRHNGLCDEREAFYTADEVESLTTFFTDDSSLSGKKVRIEKVGYAHLGYVTEEVGPAGISVVVLLGDEKFAFVSIDANNMSCGLSDKTEDAVKKLGYSEVEITTTDNHWNSGGKKGKLGYYPAGSLSPDEIIEKVMACVSNAEVSAVACGYAKTVYTKDVTVAGAGGMSALEMAASKGVRVFASSLIVDIVLAFLYILLR